tara:strand:- start:53 stop:1204 length:1152 start_codon:yes stop_codon:yes gene_type:complete
LTTDNYPSKPCAAPLTSVAIKPNGRLRPCCWWTDDEEPRLANTSIKDYVNKDLQFIYAYMKQGKWPKGCNKCNTTQKSRYDYYERRYPTARDEPRKLRTMDLRFGTLCNASCITCSSTNSNYFYKVKSQGLYLTPEHIPFKDQTSIDSYEAEQDWWKNPRNIKEITDNLDTVDHLYVTGGEPTINPMFHSILEHLHSQGRTKQVSIEVNTNGTNLNQSFKELIQPFKKTVLFSIDGHGLLNNAMRYPTKFSAVEKNILAYSSIDSGLGDEVIVTPTVCVFNFFKLVPLLDWCLYNRIRVTEKLNVLNRPAWQSLAQLPKDLLQQGLDSLEYSGYSHHANTISSRIQGESYNKDPLLSWEDTLQRTSQWFTSRGFDPSITGMYQ